MREEKIRDVPLDQKKVLYGDYEDSLGASVRRFVDNAPHVLVGAAVLAIAAAFFVSMVRQMVTYPAWFG